jgi:7-carboxy-7-deazaguanine synthase
MGDQRDPEGVWRMRHEQRRVNLAVLQSLWDQYPEHQMKFVVAAPSDCEEIDALLVRLHNWVPSDILLMPEGVVTPTQEQTAWVVQECMSRGWRYCTRLHLQLFGNRRGT